MASVIAHGQDSVHERLRRATAEQHRRLDRGLGYVLTADLSVDRYANLLAAFFGFYAPLEDELMRRQAEAPVLPLIRRADLLHRDLLALDRTPDAIPLCADLPGLLPLARTAGAIYVIEGASLGGQVIARAVRQLGVGPENGGAFFTGDGVRTGARWRQVLSWLDAVDRDRGASGEMVAAACETFGAITRWLQARRVLDE
ncbi:MAG TPA: biliverdin-producing heme oxygenase [Vicinamibacterales bacterium]